MVAPPALQPRTLVSAEVPLGDRQHVRQVGGSRRLHRVLGAGGREEGAANDRVLHEVQQVGRGGPARSMLHGCESGTGGAAAQVTGSAGITQLEPGSSHVLHDGLQFHAVRTNGRERQVPERDPGPLRRRLVPLEHGGQRRHRDPPEHRGRFDHVAQVRIEIVEEHLDQFLDDLRQRSVSHDEVGMADECFARQLQCERVTTSEAPRPLGPVTGEAFAGDELGGAGFGRAGRGARPPAAAANPAPYARQRWAGCARPARSSCGRAAMATAGCAASRRPHRTARSCRLRVRRRKRRRSRRRPAPSVGAAVASPSTDRYGRAPWPASARPPDRRPPPSSDRRSVPVTSAVLPMPAGPWTKTRRRPVRVGHPGPQLVAFPLPTHQRRGCRHRQAVRDPLGLHLVRLRLSPSRRSSKPRGVGQHRRAANGANGRCHPRSSASYVLLGHRRRVALTRRDNRCTHESSPSASTVSRLPSTGTMSPQSRLPSPRGPGSSPRCGSPMTMPAPTAGSTSSPTGRPPTARRDTDLYRSMAANPAFADLSVREFDVLDEPTAITASAFAAANAG